MYKKPCGLHVNKKYPHGFLKSRYYGLTALPVPDEDDDPDELEEDEEDPELLLLGGGVYCCCGG
jgi:hypothetical protein